MTTRASQVDDALDLWDEAELALQLSREVLTMEPTELTSASSPRGPGCYVLFYAGRAALYRSAGRGALAIYAGAATSLAGRLGRHRVSLTAVDDFEVQDFFAAVVPTCSAGQASYVEHLLTTKLQPVWNDIRLRGFGSRAQGTTRQRGQIRSPWDTLHPGRPWATGRLGHDVAELRHLARSKARLSATRRR